MSLTAAQNPSATQRIDELGRIIMAYSEVTERLQHSHDLLKNQVEHLRQELGEKNRLLERKNRLAALGEMAAGMAHEIRNPLGGIQLYASMLSQDVADRPQTHALVEKITSGVQRLESLVSHVLQFTREIRANLMPLDLHEIVEQSLDLAANLHANVRRRIDGPRPMRVSADPILLGQALLNLVLNALEAMGNSGELNIDFFAPPDGSQARQFHLIVRDTGPGIPAGLMDRIFNPFFTTKETGTGLGLAIVHRIVEAHDGSISASNDPQGGARFEIRI